MPTYVYGLVAGTDPKSGCDHCRVQFEVSQRMVEDPLTICPECKAPIERKIQAPNIGNVGDRLKGPSSSSMEKAGFTQYKRSGKGHYEKSFGKGPRHLGGT